MYCDPRRLVGGVRALLDSLDYRHCEPETPAEFLTRGQRVSNKRSCHYTEENAMQQKEWQFSPRQIVTSGYCRVALNCTFPQKENC